MKTALGHIATIQTGIFAKTEAKGDVVYLQSKHFDEFGALSSVLHPDLKASKLTHKHLLHPGDVLFAAKGAKNFAAWYESKNLPAVASTTFFVIRVDASFTDKILPEFLVWFINHPNTQSFLKGQARGTSMVSISKYVLEDLEIPIPDLKKQQTIVNIARLRNREKTLKLQIDSLRETQIQLQLINATA